MSAVEFRLPDVGEGIHEAEIVKWLVEEGERVQEFDPLVEVQTDKAIVELPAPASGVIGSIMATPGSIMRVGDVLVVIEQPGYRSDTGPAQPETAFQTANHTGTGMASSHSETPVGSVDLTPGVRAVYRPKATPGVRHYAREMGVKLASIPGTGPGGRILKVDIDRFLESKKVVNHIHSDDADNSLLWSAAKKAGQDRVRQSFVQPERNEQPDGDSVRKPLYATNKPALAAAELNRAPTRVPFRGIRRAVAEHVKRSAFTAPHVTAFDECDATELVALRKRWNILLESEGQRLSYLPFIIKATVSALKAFPYFNARLDEEAQEIELLPNYHVGIAVDTQDGLFVPVVRHADSMTIREIGEEIYRLSAGARDRTLSQEDLRGSTFTITNMGPIGGLFATPILNYPEVAILAVHQIQRKPVAVDEQVVIRDVLSLSLSFDHRVIDGASSVRFLNHMKHLIENPDLLMLELR
jgi:pyruvate dehydrogenase E2 component (dihydrolipoamide acetyltransferase)